MSTKIKLLSLCFIFILCSCHKDNNDQSTPPDTTDINNTYDFNILNKLKGIWAGPFIQLLLLEISLTGLLTSDQYQKTRFQPRMNLIL